MGFTSTRGQQLCSGFQTYIGGKVVELDCQIPQSQFPGSDTEAHNINNLVLEPIHETTKPITVNSFYGISKPKSSGPLWVDKFHC